MTYDEKVRKLIDKYVDENLSLIIGEVTSDEIRHIKDIGESIVRTRDNIAPFGGIFVYSIVENNLEKAVSYADRTCIKALKLFVLIKLWCHVEQIH